MTQLRWLGVGCLVLGGWLMATALIYVDVLGFCVALLALGFGAVYIRR
ncbi:MAG: hypothetical protein ACR2JG_00910 [Geodermatophilaceae bacterium]